MISQYLEFDAGRLQGINSDRPFDSSSNYHIFKKFKKMKYDSGVGNRLQMYNRTLQDLSVKMEIFDIVLMHNSFNHINEEIISLLKFLLKARNTFMEEFKSIRSHIALNATYIFGLL